MMKKITWSRKLLVIFAGIIIAVACFIPVVANATDYPGVEESEITGNQFETQVGLKASSDQLKFTGPTVINFAATGDGTFQVPTNAKFTNESIFDLKISSYNVSTPSGIYPVTKAEFDTAAYSGDTYYTNVAATPDGKVKTGDLDFAHSNSSVSDFIIPCDTTKVNNNMLLSFEGKIKNVTPGKWTSGQNLQTVTWFVAAA